MTEQRSPVDQALDLFVYAPVGLAVEIVERLPGFTEEGRKRLQIPFGAAGFVGRAVVNQARNGVGKRLQDAVEPYFAGDPQKTRPGAPIGESGVVTDAKLKTVPDPTKLPISGYTTLSATQIIEMLSSLPVHDLAPIEAYEVATRKRKSILDRITELRAGA